MFASARTSANPHFATNFSLPERWYRHRCVAGLEGVSPDVSCGNDAETYLHSSWKNLSTIQGQQSVKKSLRVAKMWFLTTGPRMRISVFFAERAEREDCRRVLEDLHRHEDLNVVNVYCRFLICLHFSIGCESRCSVSGYPYSFQFRQVQIFLLGMCNFFSPNPTLLCGRIDLVPKFPVFSAMSPNLGAQGLRS